MEFGRNVKFEFNMAAPGVGNDVFGEDFVCEYQDSCLCMTIWLEVAGRVQIKHTFGGTTFYGYLNEGASVPAETPWPLVYSAAAPDHTFNLKLENDGKIRVIEINEGI